MLPLQRPAPQRPRRAGANPFRTARRHGRKYLHHPAHHNLIITDGAEVRFGNHVFIAPNCCFTTADHALDAEQRRAGLEVAKPIRVGNDVWIGAGTTVLAGASIGDGTVIGAGSVVKGEIPAGVIAVGVPCRVLRKITEADKRRYPTAPEL